MGVIWGTLAPWTETFYGDGYGYGDGDGYGSGDGDGYGKKQEARDHDLRWECLNAQIAEFLEREES